MGDAFCVPFILSWFTADSIMIALGIGTCALGTIVGWSVKQIIAVSSVCVPLLNQLYTLRTSGP